MAAEGNHGAGASADRHQERRDSAGTHHRRYGTVADPPPGSSRRGPWPDSARGRVQQSFGQSLHRRGPLQADAPRPAAPVCHPLYRIGRGHSDRGAVAGAQRRRRSGATHVWAFAERTQPSDGTKGEVLKAGWTAFGRGGTLNPLLPKHRHSRSRSIWFCRVEQLVHTENRTSTLKFPQVALLGPSGLDGRFNSFRRRTQPPSNGPKELRLGWQVGVTPLRAKIVAEPGGKLSCRRRSAVAPKGSALLLELSWGEKASRGAFGARRPGEARDSPCFCVINP